MPTLARLALLATLPLAGCLNLDFGSERTVEHRPSTGQQLLDLKKAKDAGAITDAEYEVQKQQVLRAK